MSTNGKIAGQEPIWRLSEAKARIGEVVRRAAREGPQHTGVRAELGWAPREPGLLAGLATDAYYQSSGKY